MFAEVSRSALPAHLSRTAALCLAAVLALGATGCGNSEVWVYIDNGGTESMTVAIDGKNEATIAPGKFEVIKCQPGKRRFQVECGRSVLYSGTRELQESDKWGTTRKFLFNPDDRNRYVTYTVKYGSNRFAGLVQSVIESQTDKAGAIRVAYAKLAKEVTVHATGVWVDVSSTQYVLTSPPESVRSKASSATRTALTRVARADYAALDRALGKTDPSERDLEALAEAVEKVLDAAD